MHGQPISLGGSQYAQNFAMEDIFTASYSMEVRGLVGDALMEFISTFSVPEKIVMDGAGEPVDFYVTEPEGFNKSLVEGVIRVI